MAIQVQLTMKCDQSGCGKTFSKESPEMTRHLLDVAAREAGWQWKSAEKHFCPDHNTSASQSNGKVKHPIKVGKGKASLAKKPSSKKRTMASGVSTRKGPKVFEYGKQAVESNGNGSG